MSPMLAALAHLLLSTGLVAFIGYACWRVACRLYGSDRPVGLKGVEARCPHCRRDLVTGGAFVGETANGLVLFACRGCGAESTWDFGPPAPVLVHPRRPGAGAGLDPDDIV